MRNIVGTSSRRRGIAAVELAVLLPFVLLLLVGVWEVGRLVEVQQLLTNAVREGGRQASTGHKTIDQVKDDVVRYLHQNGIKAVTTSDVTVTNVTSGIEPTLANQLDQFRISVSIPVDSVRWVLLDQVTSLTTLTATVDWYSMRDIPITVQYEIPLQ
jgi:Flp pilus assembly protein TadG